ncbi:MAG TPA: glycoside hydrolase family 3 N-terminal domain-containing protein [Terriglobales bacterium]|nr:glycoside hydrolase family 3 N-terminal domain-containing protein [Terriglobales bacterium]
MISASAQSNSSALNDPRIDTRVNVLLNRMTLQEKIGQLVQYSAGSPTGPGTGRTDYPDMIAQGGIGSLFNLTGAREVNAMQKIAVEKSRLHIPLIFGLDVIHGYRTTFPVPLGMSATWNPNLVEKAARISAIEASQEGVRWTFSPMVDIARDARWGRIVEGAGEDTYLGQAIARAYVRGYQGTNLANPDSILACLKHYVAYGAAEAGRDYNTVDISHRSLRQVYLPPFKAGIDQGAATVMSAFDDLQGVPASANHYTLTQILRGEWGFRGFVVSDWNSVGELIPQGVALDQATAARKALTAGVDMDMESNSYGPTLQKQVQSGQIPESVVDEAVRRILRVKFAMGLFDHPYTDESKGNITSLDPEHVATARTVAEESFVLLKNAAVSGAPVLPLASSAKTIALIGPLADSATDMLGSWSTKGDPKDVVTLRQALSDRLAQSQGKLIYAKGTDILTNSEAGFAEAVSAAQEADVVVAALGEDAALMTGEAASRAHLNLPGNQEKLLEAVASTGKPVVLVVFSGRPLILDWEASHIPAILEAWFPGVQAGPALVRTLFGDANPSGRLTTSFPRAVGQEPLYYNHMNTGRPADGVDLSHPPTDAKEKYLSRYIDEQNSPLFPFGFGLSYTTFQYSSMTLSAQSLKADALNNGSAALTVSAEVKNTGTRAGAEVVQLYIRQQGTSVTRPVRELKGFQKVVLAPGESKRVEFKLGRDEFAFWNIDMKDVVEPAKVTIWVGPNSIEGSEAAFTIQ